MQPNKPTVVPDKNHTASVTLTFDYAPDHFSSSPEHWDWAELIGLSPLYFSIKSVASADTPQTVTPAIAELSAQLLHALMYTHDAWTSLAPRLIHPNDHPIERIKVVPHNIGCMIRDADPHSCYFHVELDPPLRAEIWSARAWRESITRRLRHAPEHTDNSFVAQRRRLHNDLLYKIAHKTRRKYDECSNIADLILDYGENYDAILSLIDASDDILEKVKQYRLDKIAYQQQPQ